MTISRRVGAIRIALSVAVVAGAAVVFLGFANLHRTYGVIVGVAAALALLWGFRGVFSRRRVILWLEERLPDLRYALVALSEQPETRFHDVLEARVRATSTRRPLTIALVRLAALPLAVVIVLQLIAKPLIARTVLSGSAAGVPGAPGRRATAGDQSFVAIVTPPNYSRIAADTIDNPMSVSALVGSDIRFAGAWSAQVAMPRVPTVLRLAGPRERIVALEPRADSAPTVVIELPARDTALPAASGVITLAASVRDDIGITASWFEMIVSSGDGELFNFRSIMIGRLASEGAQQLRLNAALRLDTLGLKPGDIVHLRAVARDANPSRDAEPGSSETRTLRVFRRGEGDSVAVEAAPPPEVGRSELSQRMLINMPEKLVAEMRRLSRPDVTREANNIAREQARLRRRVGAIIFTRLTGDEPEPDDTAGIDVDTLPPGEALLRAASEATNAADHVHSEEQGGDGTVIGINAPLLEAFNAMWEAERRLGVVEPRQALPHMRAALAAIQRARAAERLYLRGRPPKIVIDLARIRLSGKRDAIDPGARSPRASAIAATTERRARFYAALDRLVAEPAAGIDSLTLLRVDALTTAPAFAASLGVAIDDLRAGRDATTSILAARRALSGAPTSGGNPRWSGF